MKGACRDRARQGRCRSKEAGLAAKQAFSFFLFLFLVVLFFRGRRGLFPFHVGGSTPPCAGARTVRAAYGKGVPNARYGCIPIHVHSHDALRGLRVDLLGAGPTASTAIESHRERRISKSPPDTPTG